MLSLALKEIDSLKNNDLELESFLLDKNPKVAHVISVLLDYEWDNSLEVINSFSLNEKLYIAEEAIEFNREYLLTELIGDSIEVSAQLIRKHPNLDYINDSISYFLESYSKKEYIEKLQDSTLGFGEKLRGSSSINLEVLNIENEGLDFIFKSFKCDSLGWQWNDKSLVSLEILESIEGENFVVESWFKFNEFELDYIDSQISQDSSFLNKTEPKSKAKRIFDEAKKITVNSTVGLLIGPAQIGVDVFKSYIEFDLTQDQLFLRITAENFNRTSVYERYKKYITDIVESRINKFVVDIPKSFELFEKSLYDNYLNNLNEGEKSLLRMYQIENRKEAKYKYIRTAIEGNLEDSIKEMYLKGNDRY